MTITICVFVYTTSYSTLRGRAFLRVSYSTLRYHTLLLYAHGASLGPQDGPFLFHSQDSELTCADEL